jgi:SAM-dependent methyltransferase
MRDVVYWQKADRLVYFDEKATANFWDSHWQAEGPPPVVGKHHDIVAISGKYLARGSRILEGGCGRANKLKAMADAGYSPIGIDFAPASVRQARLDYPNLDIRQGDVRSLDFPDAYFDGYWSLGVIEHFWTGYDAIMAEAARVLRPKGFLFLTAPWLSPYRRHKVRAGGYPCEDFRNEPDGFFQFALSREEVSAALLRHGFEIMRWHGRASEISLRDDMIAFQRQTRWLLRSRGSLMKRAARWAIFTGLNKYCGHAFLAVARRAADFVPARSGPVPGADEHAKLPPT